MAKTISSLNVVLGATAAPFEAAFRGAATTVNNFESALGGVGSAILKLTGAGLAIGAIKGVFDKAFAAPGEAIAAAGRQADAQSRLAAVLKATGGAAGYTADQLLAQADAFKKATTFDDDAIVEFQGVLATFRNVSGQTFTEATSLALDMASVMGTDLQSAGVQLGKALNDPTEGISALTRVGVSFTEQQKAQIKSMQEAGNVAGAQAIILNELKGEFGGAAEAMAKTPYGRFKQIGNEIDDLAKPVGTTLLSIVTGFADAFNLSGAIGTLQGWLDTAQGYISAAVTMYAPIVASGLQTVWGVVSNAFSAIYAYVEPIMTSIGTFISDNWQAALESSTTYLGGVYDVVAGTLEGAKVIATSVWDGITTVWNGACDMLGVNTAKLGTTAGGVFQNIASVGNWMRDAVGKAFTVIGYTFANIKTVIEFVGTTIALAVVSTGNEIAYTFTDRIPHAFDLFMAGLQDLVSFTKAVFQNLAANAVAVFTNLPGLISGTTDFSKIWTPLTTGFESALKQVPALADRQASPLEQALGKQASDLAETFSGGLVKKFGDSMARNKGMSKAVEESIQKALGGAKPTPFDVPPPKTVDIPKPKPADTKGATGPLEAVTAKAKEAKSAISALDAILSGSAESQRAMYAGQGFAEAPAAPSTQVAAAPVTQATMDAAAKTAATPTANGDESPLLAAIRDAISGGNGIHQRILDVLRANPTPKLLATNI